MWVNDITNERVTNEEFNTMANCFRGAMLWTPGSLHTWDAWRFEDEENDDD